MGAVSCDTQQEWWFSVPGYLLFPPPISQSPSSTITNSPSHHLPGHRYQNHHHPPSHHLPTTHLTTAKPPLLHLSPPSPTDLGHRWKCLLRCVVHHYQGSKLSNIIFDIKVALASQSVPLLKTLQHFRWKTKGCCGHWLLPLFLSPLIKNHHVCRMAIKKRRRMTHVSFGPN